MKKRVSAGNAYFWLLLAVSGALFSLAMLLGWIYGLMWLEAWWRLCQASLSAVAMHVPWAWQGIILALLLLTLIRAALSLVRQVRATRRLNHLFRPFAEAPPARVQALAAARGLSQKEVVFLNLEAPHAFCLGFWRPRLWLTAGLVDLLTPDELAAVLAHEAYHCRRRDPLRLLIVRVLASAFFFLPLVGNLARAAELQQELAADRAAVQSASGNDLPLLCALQKLLRLGADDIAWPPVAVSYFNKTEARLRRLIYPSSSLNWRKYLKAGLINLLVLATLGGAVLISTSPASIPHAHEYQCPTEPADST